jgi:hypothetical protein
MNTPSNKFRKSLTSWAHDRLCKIARPKYDAMLKLINAGETNREVIAHAVTGERIIVGILVFLAATYVLDQKKATPPQEPGAISAN